MIDTQAQKIRQSFHKDSHRPIYHFLPPANWMNDPNGLIQWDGQYHLFYQYNPNAAYHANMHWGHAVSDDLIHWRDLPIALAPTPNSVDEGGIFSGCAVNNDGIPTIFYTGVSPNYDKQVQCMVIGDDNLLTWEKYANNPVIGEVPAVARQTSDFRDPFVWKEDDTWYMLVGSHIVDKGGAVFLYQSDSLIDWDYVGILYAAERENLGTVWECPNFFKLGDKWVLIVSLNTNNITGDVIYFVGDYVNHRFVPEYQAILDHAYLYAPLTIEDDSGRRLMWAWIREGRSVEAYTEAGWSGVQCIPRMLSLDEHNRLLTQPVEELEIIRGQRHHYANLMLDEERVLDARGLTLDVEAQFEVTETSIIILALACSADARIATEIHYNAATQQLSVNREKSSTDSRNEGSQHLIDHALAADETLDLRILLDGSVVEIIANKRSSITSRIYPGDSEDNTLKLSGSDARLIELNVYEMPSIWSFETSS